MFKLLSRAVVSAVVVSLAVMVASASAGPQVAIRTNGSSTDNGWAIFAEPATGTDDPAILNHIKALIDGVPCGQDIRMGINSISNGALPDSIRNALNAKQNAPCYADVKVVVNGSAKELPDTSTYTGAERLRDALGSGTGFKWCDHGYPTNDLGGGCVSWHRTGGMHAKYLLLESSYGQPCVSWFGSANLTAQTGTQTYNNGITTYNNCALYNNFLNRLWTPSWNQPTYANNDTYQPSAGRGYFESGPAPNVTAHISPENSDPRVDFVRDRLNGINPGAACDIRIGQAEWTHRGYDPADEAIANRLIALKNSTGGCSIRIVVGNRATNNVETNGEANMNRQIWDDLKATGMLIQHGPIHDKYFTIHGQGEQYAVVTGSHNFTEGAWKQNDELLIKIANSPSTYNAYRNHWQRTYDAANTCTSYGPC